MKTFLERIDNIEKKFGYVKGRVSGTSLSRALLKDEGVGWLLSVGLMQDVKRHFYGKTIDEVLSAAENFGFTKEGN